MMLSDTKSTLSEVLNIDFSVLTFTSSFTLSSQALFVSERVVRLSCMPISFIIPSYSCSIIVVYAKHVMMFLHDITHD